MMNNRNRIAMYLLAGSMLFGLGCHSANKPVAESKQAQAKPKPQPVAESEVPKPVLDSWAATYPAAKASAWTQRGDVYTAKGQDATHWLSISFFASGALRETQEELALDAAPAAVKSAFATSPYAKMTFIDGIKQVAVGKQDANATLYKFVLKDGEKNVVAVYGSDGALVKEKSMTADKFDKWRTEHPSVK